MSFAVHARSKETGEWKMLHPTMKSHTEKFLWIFKVSYQVPVKYLDKMEAVELAKKEFDTDKYQDIRVLQENIDPEGYHQYYPSCIWENGKWCRYSVDKGEIYNYN